jgi:hypothetical protein
VVGSIWLTCRYHVDVQGRVLIVFALEMPPRGCATPVARMTAGSNGPLGAGGYLQMHSRSRQQVMTTQVGQGLARTVMRFSPGLRARWPVRAAVPVSQPEALDVRQHPASDVTPWAASISGGCLAPQDGLSPVLPA